MTNMRMAIELEEKKVDIINLKRNFLNSFVTVSIVDENGECIGFAHDDKLTVKDILLQFPKEKRENIAKYLMTGWIDNFPYHIHSGFAFSCGRYEEEMSNMEDFSWIHNVVK